MSADIETSSLIYLKHADGFSGHATEYVPELIQTGADGRYYTRRQLEHFGDAIFGLTARNMAHSRIGNNQRLYFQFAERLVSNSNLLSNGQHADYQEVRVGEVYIAHGHEAACALARERLELTLTWNELAKMT